MRHKDAEDDAHDIRPFINCCFYNACGVLLKIPASWWVQITSWGSVQSDFKSGIQIILA